ncbi:MAG: hypothetical protein ACRDZN_08265 [Acidimicrobiales bacterium]
MIIEVQSELYHSALTDTQDDDARLGQLRAAGFEVVEVTEGQVWHRAHEVVALVRDAYRRHRPAGVSAPRILPRDWSTAGANQIPRQVS